jgi:hypothetical protein
MFHISKNYYILVWSQVLCSLLKHTHTLHCIEVSQTTRSIIVWKKQDAPWSSIQVIIHPSNPYLCIIIEKHHMRTLLPLRITSDTHSLCSYFTWCLVLGSEYRISSMLCKHFATELHLQSFLKFYFQAGLA